MKLNTNKSTTITASLLAGLQLSVSVAAYATPLECSPRVGILSNINLCITERVLDLD
jgi:hypothetical protein